MKSHVDLNSLWFMKDVYQSLFQEWAWEASCGRAENPIVRQRKEEPQKEEMGHEKWVFGTLVINHLTWQFGRYRS